MIEKPIDFLLKAQNPDGGWGAEKGNRSNTEATSFAILALNALRDKSLAKNIDQGLSWLIDQQNSDGSFPLNVQLNEGSWTTAPAILSLTPFEAHRQRALRAADWLLLQRGRGLGWLLSLIHLLAPQKQAVRLNPDLKGWGWMPGTFSWVEPTAYALIALKKLDTASFKREASGTLRVQ